MWTPEGWAKNAKPNRRWRKEQRMAWAFALFFLIPPSPAHATTVVKMALETVVAEADRIAVCQVIDITPSRDLKNGAPITRVTFEPVEWWKGDSGEPTVALEFLGEPVGDDTVLVVAGMPQFERGNRYVLFWRDGETWANPIVGWHQGSYAVVQGETGDLYVEEPETQAEEITVHASQGEADDKTTWLENTHNALMTHLQTRGAPLSNDQGRAVQAQKASRPVLLSLQNLKGRVAAAMGGTP